MAASKYVYFFGDGKAEGSSEMKALLGGKGANLAEMTNLGVPVPPGFTISTEVCEAYYQGNLTYPAGSMESVGSNLKRLEKLMNKKLGDPKDPLLVSVRSGAAISMPGMMDTVLNLGLNDTAVIGLAELTGNERFAWDAYRRFIQMFGNVAKGVGHGVFENILAAVKSKKGVEKDTDLDAGDLEGVVAKYQRAYQKALGEEFPQDPKEQMQASIDAVFGSWNNSRAIKYRKINDIRDLKGTAVNVQSMVFGNSGEDSGTGVCFTRDPSTGKNEFYGEYLMNAQGEDVVAGIRTPSKISALKRRDPEVYQQLVGLKNRLEKHYRDIQDIEFTIQQGALYILQTRTAKRTGMAAVNSAVEMVGEKLITRETAISRVTPDQLDQMLHPMIDSVARKQFNVVAKGLNASPGAAAGRIVFTADEAEAWVANGESVLLVRKETSPEDIGGMNVAEGILTSTGGMTSHAAVVARGMGIPCVAGCTSVSITGKSMRTEAKTFREGDWVTIDGTSGEVIDGRVPLVDPKITRNLEVFLGWADQVRRRSKRSGVTEKGFVVRANADKPEDAKVARGFGAEGIGLCRTEHMFFGDKELIAFQEMIIADDERARKRALKKLLPLQKKDFVGIFKAMNGYPVTIRLLDPPLHEFVPKTKQGIKELSATLETPVRKLQEKIDQLHEFNPMLGHRGCRLGITYPEIYDMQVEAIISAACSAVAKGVKVIPEIMIPLIGTYQELELLRRNAVAVAESVIQRRKTKVKYLVGTMIEIPRAALTADEVAEHADFFSFGTNDLTQMTFGYSRDDIGTFVQHYLEQGVLESDPFESLDQSGVGQLVRTAVEKGRSRKANLKMGICGEHGGDPASIQFCYQNNLNYVSCSPYRVPIARLAAAQAALGL